MISGATNPSLQLSTQLRPSNSLDRWLGHLRVGQKISLGYGLVLSAAVLGTAIGFMIADYYQKQAQYEEEDAIEELYQVYRLKSSVFRLRTRQHKLVLYLGQPSLWQEKYSQFGETVTETRQAWSEFRLIFQNPNRRLKDTPQEKEAFDQLMRTKPSFDKYLEQSKLLFEMNTAKETDPTSLQITQAKLFNFMHNPQVFTLDEFLTNITRLVDVTAAEYNQAKADLRNAEKLRLQIIASGLLVSIAIASLLAMYMNRAITHPIQVVTHIAQQVTEESNFDLQAPVLTHDEIGILAASLNRLIQEVQQLLDAQKDANEQLEVYSQVLEKKVQERTQELKEKNRSLQKTLEALRLTQARLVQTGRLSTLEQAVTGIDDESDELNSSTETKLAIATHHVQNLLELIELYRQHYPDSTPLIQQKVNDIGLKQLETDLPRLFNSMQLDAKSKSP
jgi:HAMP domain-containing protein